MRNGYEEGKFKEGIVMKANTPEKIYLQEPTKVRTEKKYDNDIEYTSTDAFIEKACEFLKSYRQNTPDGFGYIAGIVNDETIEDFKNYMRGE